VLLHQLPDGNAAVSLSLGVFGVHSSALHCEEVSMRIAQRLTPQPPWINVLATLHSSSDRSPKGCLLESLSTLDTCALSPGSFALLFGFCRRDPAQQTV
jgi:hypothetical protein